MLKVSVKIKKKHNATKGLIGGVDEAVKQTLELLESTAKAYAPVDTGFLKGNIFTRMKRRLGYLISKAPYSIFQEEGPRAANGGIGYMKPAVQFVKTRITGLFGKNIRANMRRS